MSCESTLKAVERFLEGEVGPEALAGSTPEGAHAAGCAACRAEVESALHLSEALQGALLTAAPEGALDRALAAVRAEAGAQAAGAVSAVSAAPARVEAGAAPAATATAGAASAGAPVARFAAPVRRFRPGRALAVAASVVVAVGMAFIGQWMLVTQGGPRIRPAGEAKHAGPLKGDLDAETRMSVAARPIERGSMIIDRAGLADHSETSGEDELVVLATDGVTGTGAGGGAIEVYRRGVEMGVGGGMAGGRVTFAAPGSMEAADQTLYRRGPSSGASATAGSGSWGSLPDKTLADAIEAADAATKAYAGPNPYAKDDPRSREWDRKKDEAAMESIARMQAASAQTIQRSEKTARRLQEEMVEAMRQREEALRQQEAESARWLAKLKADIQIAATHDRAKMQAELDTLSKHPSSEAARKIISDAEASLVLIYAESYVQAKGARERTPICKLEATGFAIAKDRIVTAKHVIQPWKYDAKVLATARKLKQEQGFEVRDYIEIYRKTRNGWEKRYDTAAGTCRVLAIAADQLEEKAQTVEIDWNQVVTAVPGIQVHRKNADDVAIIEVPGGDFRPVSLGTDAPQEFENTIVIGTLRNAENKLISVSPARGEVQTRSDAAFSLNCTVPTSFGGAPIFKYDGSVYGMAAGPEAQNLVCMPVRAIRWLLRSTGNDGAGASSGAPGSGAPSGGSVPSGSAAPFGGAGVEDDESEPSDRVPIMLPEGGGAGKGGGGGVEPGASTPRRGALGREEAFRKLSGGSLFAKGEDGATVDLMPLERVSVQAEVAGTLATTLVRQRFGNPFPVKIEAVYAFPLPTDAAVNEFVMQVGDRRIRGIVRERKEARAIYQAARGAGRVASLLEQERPNVFHIAIANIEPSRAVDVSIRFFQALSPQDGTLEYVLPLVIGHRYGDDARAVASGSATRDAGVMGGGHAAVAPPRAAAGERAPAGAERPECEIDIAIDAGVPIDSLECPSHDVAIDRYGPFRARVLLPSQRDVMDRDFVLRLRIGREKEATFGVVAHAGPLGRFLQLVAAPPLAPDDESVQAREIVFVLDSSGSMSGVPIEQSKRFIRKALASLRAKDVFTVATFAGDARLMSERFLPPTPRDINHATRWVESLSGAGGTEAEAGIRLALEMPGDPRRVRIVVFLTDGGVSFEGDIFARIKQSGAGARVFALGVGSAPNRHLLDGMAEAGRGVAAYIAQDASEDVIARDVARLYARLDAPVLCDVRVVTEGGIALDDVFPREAADLFVGRTLSILARYRSGGTGAIVVRGRAGGAVVERRIPVTLPSDDPSHAALAPIWARAAIADREKEIPLVPQEKRAALEDEIRRIAIDFQLASRVTSFVAVDEGSGTGRGEPARVAQPAAVPAGVDAGSFGGEGR